MASPSTLTQGNKGFTLIEIIIALGIIALIFAVSLFVSFDFYKSYSFHSEKDVLISALQKARNQSLNNINEVRHGVRLTTTTPAQYIIFQCPAGTPQCTSYTADPDTDIVLDVSYHISFVSPTPTLPLDIVFDQLNGDCVTCDSPETTIRVSDGTKEYDIKINGEGRINW